MRLAIAQIDNQINTLSQPPAESTPPPPPPSEPMPMPGQPIGDQYGSYQPQPYPNQPYPNQPQPYPNQPQPYPGQPQPYPNQPQPYQGQVSSCAPGTYCGNSNYQTGPMQEGQQMGQMPMDQGQMMGPMDQQNRQDGQMMGPNEEEMQKREQMMDQQRLKDMKRGLSQFSRGFKQFQKMVQRMEPRLAKMGVGIPAELKAALDKAPAIIDAIEKAESPDELDEMIEQIEEVGSSMSEWGPKFGDLMRLGGMLKQADKELKNVQRAIKRVQTYVKKNPALGDAIAELESLGTTLRQTLQEVRTLAKTEPDTALEKLESEFYNRMEEVWTLVGQIDMLKDLSKGLQQAKKELQRIEQKVKQLARKKSTDQTLIASIKEKVSEVKMTLSEVQQLAKQRGVEFEELKDGVGSLWDAFEELHNLLDEAGSGLYDQPVIKGGENINFELPDAFNFGQGSQTCNVDGVEMPGPCSAFQQ